MFKKHYILLAISLFISVLFFIPNNAVKSQSLFQTFDSTNTPEVTPTETPNIPATIESDILTKIAPTYDFRQPTPNILATAWVDNNTRAAERQNWLEYLVYLSLTIALVAIILSFVSIFIKKTLAPELPPSISSSPQIPSLFWKNFVLVLFTILPIIGLIIGFIIFLMTQK